MSVIVDRRLYLTSGGSLAEVGDPRGVSLWATAGQSVSDEAAEKVGYTPASEPEPARPRDEPEDPAPETEPGGQGSEPDGPESAGDPLPDGHVACPVDGCDYTGTERGLKVHARSHEREGA